MQAVEDPGKHVDVHCAFFKTAHSAQNLYILLHPHSHTESDIVMTYHRCSKMKSF